MTKRLNRFLLALVLLVGLPGYWLLFDNRPGDVPAKPLSMTKLRAAASSLTGPQPIAIEVETIGLRELPGTLFVAGAGFRSKPVTVMAFRVVLEQGGEVLIDSGLTQSAATEMGIDTYFPSAQARLNAALQRARPILITHEHPDHIGGVAAANQQVLSRARLNQAQATGLAKPSLPGNEIEPVAPGIVVVPAPSHTPGSQVIFVRLKDGREYLFAGDIATYQQSWQELRARSRLLGDWLAPEDRDEVYSWLKTFQALKTEAPALIVVPGHDLEALFDADRPSGIRRGFSS